MTWKRCFQFTWEIRSENRLAKQVCRSSFRSFKITTFFRLGDYKRYMWYYNDPNSLPMTIISRYRQFFDWTKTCKGIFYIFLSISYIKVYFGVGWDEDRCMKIMPPYFLVGNTRPSQLFTSYDTSSHFNDIKSNIPMPHTNSKVLDCSFNVILLR